LFILTAYSKRETIVQKALDEKPVVSDIWADEAKPRPVSEILERPRFIV